MNYHNGWQLFKRHANKRGYNHKVVGDEAFTNRKGEIIRLKKVFMGCSNIEIYEENYGIYTVEAAK